jgi:hypothetical protein
MPDLIDDETWREAALARMSEAFFGSQLRRGWRADRLPEEQIPAYTDRSMMDHRYGAVVKIIKRIVGDRVRVVAHVKLDKSGKTVRVILFDCTEI